MTADTGKFSWAELQRKKAPRPTIR